MNRAKRLLALCAALVMLLTVSAFPVMAAGTVSLQAPPAPEAIEISSDRVSLSVEVSAEDSNAQIQYRMSRDKLL